MIHTTYTSELSSGSHRELSIAVFAIHEGAVLDWPLCTISGTLSRHGRRSRISTCRTEIDESGVMLFHGVLCVSADPAIFQVSCMVRHSLLLLGVYCLAILMIGLLLVR